VISWNSPVNMTLGRPTSGGRKYPGLHHLALQPPRLRAGGSSSSTRLFRGFADNEIKRPIGDL
jgi:hypothetical protein